MRHGDGWPGRYDLSSLRLLGTVGEPINPEVWLWYRRVIGRDEIPVVDTYWQTETGGFVITPLPGAIALKPGSATVPFFGVLPSVLREDGTPADVGEDGLLCIDRPWPGLLRRVWGDTGQRPPARDVLRALSGSILHRRWRESGRGRLLLASRQGR